MNGNENQGLRTWAEISISALRHNAAALRAHAPNGARIWAVVKADAYGHGVDLVVPALSGFADGFAVANLAEAQQVRKLEPETPILIMGPALPSERAEIARCDFLPVISSQEEASSYAACAGLRPVAVHLAIDTGMGRIGVWEDNAEATFKAIAAMRGVEITGVCSHFPVADDDATFTRNQSERFGALVKVLREREFFTGSVHLANSAGVLGFTGQSNDWYRAGLALYGVSPLAEYQSLLRPVMCWKTRVILVRDFEAGRGISYGRTFITSKKMRVATLAVGYADGYRRHMSGRNAWVLIEGRRCPVLGRVTMDQIMVDVSDCPEVDVGAEAVLLGSQGSEEITATALAELAGTIAWDIFTGIGRRVTRLSVDVGADAALCESRAMSN